MPRYVSNVKCLCWSKNQYFLNIRAVLFFTGEALDEEESDEEDSDEDEDDEDADSDQDEDFDPSKAKENPECKQQ